MLALLLALLPLASARSTCASGLMETAVDAAELALASSAPDAVACVGEAVRVLPEQVRLVQPDLLLKLYLVGARAALTTRDTSQARAWLETTARLAGDAPLPYRLSDAERRLYESAHAAVHGLGPGTFSGAGTSVVDGRILSPGEARVLPAGDHLVQLPLASGGFSTRWVTLGSGQTITLGVPLTQALAQEFHPSPARNPLLLAGSVLVAGGVASFYLDWYRTGDFANCIAVAGPECDTNDERTTQDRRHALWAVASAVTIGFGATGLVVGGLLPPVEGAQP